MKEQYRPIWNAALPYLQKGMMKDFVIHTQGVIRAMETLVGRDEDRECILIPAAILHDVGWANVPEFFQKSNDAENKRKALQLHLELAPPIIKGILYNAGYGGKKVQEVVDIVQAHKFQEPDELEKMLLIDADAMADAFKDQFDSDVKSYGTTPEGLYNFRKEGNKFYSGLAKQIFKRELEERRKEFQTAKS